MPATIMPVAIVDQGLVSAYGDGVACCAEGLLSGRSALVKAGDAFSAPLQDFPVGVVPGLERGPGRLMRLLERLLGSAPAIPADAVLYAATTVGEIDALQSAVREGPAEASEGSRVSTFAARVEGLLKRPPATGLTFSAACASSTAAVAMAASAIRRGEISCALVVGGDIVSEFTLSGFSALMALDAQGARPFDAERKGISLGEAAAYVVLMSDARAEQEKRAVLGTIHGWGMTCDANHLTGPSRDGVPLADAIEQALRMSGLSADDVDALCAHGTGTPYNDQMELLAFQRAMMHRKVPLFSVKGGMGHTLGAAGLAEVLLSLEFLKRATIPPTVGLRIVSPEAEGWASSDAQTLARHNVMLTTNSGFGGVNVALLVGRGKAGASRRGLERRVTQGRKDTRTEDRITAVRGETTFTTPKHFTRFSAEAQRASLALVARLKDEGLFWDAERVLRWNTTGAPAARVGILAWHPEGSQAMNRAYFTDYVSAGSVLGRGQLFAATLPTSVVSEVAIACCLKGPLLYVADAAGTPEGARHVARQCIADQLAEAMIVLAGEGAEEEIVFMKEGAYEV